MPPPSPVRPLASEVSKQVKQHPLDRPRAEVDEATVAIPARSGVCRRRGGGVGDVSSRAVGTKESGMGTGRTSRDKAIALGKLGGDAATGDKK